MRLVLFLFLLSSALWSETFYDRFKVIEDKVQELSFEIDNIKAGTPNAVMPKQESQKGAPNFSHKSSDKELEAMQSSIRSLEYQQRALIKELLLLKKVSLKTASNSIKTSTSKPLSKSKQKSQADDEWGDDESDEEDPSDDLSAELEEIQTKLAGIRQQTQGDNLHVSADFRTSVDSLSYLMADGSIQSNDALFSNRLWLDFKYKATENTSFISQLAYYKLYGQRVGTGDYASLSAFDWVVNTRPSDDTVRVKSAYWFYKNNTFLGTPIPWTFSLGRRPSTNGHLINLRDDDRAASPLAHFINVEFDGGSSKFDFSELTGIDGMYLKFCFGRGQSNAQENFSTAPFATDSNDLDQIDMLGLIVSLYDDKQYALKTQYVQASNLIDLNSSYTGFETVGDMNNLTVIFKMDGIGSEWSNYLDEAVFFASYSISTTAPLAGKEMIGSATAQTGSSYWVGLQLPTFSEHGKLGLEYNHGDKYWRSITYAEDTLMGSKIAARGDAYEIYWTEAIDKALSFQLRYTYIDYAYSGSNGFFGSITGTPLDITAALGAQAVDTAQDFRAYIRYRY